VVGECPHADVGMEWHLPLRFCKRRTDVRKKAGVEWRIGLYDDVYECVATEELQCTSCAAVQKTSRWSGGRAYYGGLTRCRQVSSAGDVGAIRPSRRPTWSDSPHPAWGDSLHPRCKVHRGRGAMVTRAGGVRAARVGEGLPVPVAGRSPRASCPRLTACPRRFGILPSPTNPPDGGSVPAHSPALGHGPPLAEFGPLSAIGRRLAFVQADRP